MQDPNQFFSKFFGVVGSGQAYLNALYMLLAFPLGLFYFIYLISGLAAGIPLVIIWVGIPIVLLVAAGWLLLAAFERQMAIFLLKVPIGPMAPMDNQPSGIWERFKFHLTNPVTWKSLFFLLAKFPIGLVSFVVIIVLASVSLVFLCAPLIYPVVPIAVIAVPGLLSWQIDTLSEALYASLIGLLLWPLALHITNGFAFLSAKFAQLMLGMPQPDSGQPAAVEANAAPSSS